MWCSSSARISSNSRLLVWSPTSSQYPMAGRSRSTTSTSMAMSASNCSRTVLPNYQKLLALRIGQTVREQFEADMAIEVEVVERLRPAIGYCEEVGDHTSKRLFEEILADEEHHIDYLETQISLMDHLG